jgi:mono/diheme cytochrome c family protein
MLRTLVAGAFAVACGAAFAGEGQVKIKDGPGAQQVRANCVACHSLDYIELNSPVLDHKGWDATVNKMIKAFGAQISPADVPVMVEYLTQNYGKK